MFYDSGVNNMSATKEPSPEGSRWFRISERQLYYLEMLAEQYGAFCQTLQPGSELLPVPDGISYTGLREEIRQQEIAKGCVVARRASDQNRKFREGMRFKR